MSKITREEDKPSMYEKAKEAYMITQTTSKEQKLAKKKQEREAYLAMLKARPDGVWRSLPRMIPMRSGKQESSPMDTVAIADSAPNDQGDQQIGAKFALQGKPPESITNAMKASHIEAGERGESMDLFGVDDPTIQQMAAMAKIADEFKRELSHQLAVLTKIAELHAEKARWDDWHLHPDLVARVKGLSGPKLTSP